MLKVSFFSGETETGPTVIPLFNRATDAALEKVASAQLLPDVVRYIDSLRPSKDSVYNLVNAMGAGEYFGSNINGDYFSEASLIHRPDVWTGDPLVDKIRAKDWHYGYPTFYFAHPYAHHRNKDAARAFGEVELAVWNDRMKRVELVTRVDKAKCQEFGGVSVWDKLVAGQFPDVSMGCKVPFDTCSICLDWKTYREAQDTFDPKTQKHPGEAILTWHKTKGKIRGLSITRADYCDHAKKSMNKILPDGRKVFVYNDFPKFFDISFVFIGADKTAKTMMKIASEGIRGFWDIGGSAELAEKLGYQDDGEKTAAEHHDFLARMRDDAKAKGYNLFAVVEDPKAKDGASVTVGPRPGGAVHNARQAHMAWEGKNGIDPHHDWSKEKTASTPLSSRIERMKARLEEDEDLFKSAFLGKAAKSKRSEIVKDVIPSQFLGKAVHSLTASEDDLPKSLLDTMAKAPLESSLSTSGGLGMVLRPREFQRIILINIGKRDLADHYDDCGVTFPETRSMSPMDLGPQHFMVALARLLMPLFASRSALAPAVEKRVVTISLGSPEKEKKASSSHSTELLRKIGAAYNSYRGQLMDLAAHSQDLIAGTAYPFEVELRKLSSAAPEEVFSPLSVAYIKSAFLNEVGPRHESGPSNLAMVAGVERGFPSRNT